MISLFKRNKVAGEVDQTFDIVDPEVELYV